MIDIDSDFKTIADEFVYLIETDVESMGGYYCEIIYRKNDFEDLKLKMIIKNGSVLKMILSNEKKHIFLPSYKSIKNYKIVSHINNEIIITYTSLCTDITAGDYRRIKIRKILGD